MISLSAKTCKSVTFNFKKTPVYMFWQDWKYNGTIRLEIIRMKLEDNLINRIAEIFRLVSFNILCKYPAWFGMLYNDLVLRLNKQWKNGKIMAKIPQIIIQSMPWDDVIASYKITLYCSERFSVAPFCLAKSFDSSRIWIKSIEQSTTRECLMSSLNWTFLIFMLNIRLYECN